ncbi:PAS domain-containing hybrid sensor histidine kinase/response regulator [Thalassomonas actiniarum]|uniref:Sensory/regulatory protein RpfC n=1 Tax=Thalassomonas actiniarum TaxID=485447 RepID=A0AAE9YVM7_9GAMM|nr:response regulator [Thalassomonas actiniarum]WDE00392.1 response regulator [Thalassomonas actiniarum]
MAEIEPEDKQLISFLKSALNASPDLIFAKDIRLHYQAVNEAFAKFIKLPCTQILGFKDEELFAKADMPTWLGTSDHQVLQTLNPVRREQWVKQGHETILLDILKSPIYNDQGKVIGLLGICRNITDHEKAQQSLQAEKEKAEQATAAKSEFLARMSHEIRTPMNAVLGLTRLTMNTELNPEQLDYMEKLLSSGEGLLNLIDDILDFSKIEAGKLTLEHTTFSLEKLIRQSINLTAINAHLKGIELITDIASDIPEKLIGDPLRLQQILVNLLNNAVKFTDIGTVCLKVRVKGKTDQHLVLHCTVIDTGIGISQEQQKNLFDCFTQADDSMTRKHGGTGLGLAISKQLTELMSGNIWLNSKPGQGSQFHFTVRLGQTKEQANQQPIEKQQVANLKVLVVDDTRIARMVLLAMLSSLGISADQVDNAMDAIAKIKQARTEKSPYDLILMDWRMPDMDGLEASREIYRLHDSAAPPILMVSAFDKDEAKNNALKSGTCIHQFIEKPVSQSTLVDAISTILTTPTPQTLAKDLINRKIKAEIPGLPPQASAITERKKATVPDFSGFDILIVDDNELNCRVAQGFLKDSRVNIDLAENGLIAIEKIQQRHYDLILMDIQMPQMDGLSATSHIRKILKLEHLPVIAMTAHAMEADIIRSREAGMTAHLTKPITPEVLYQTLLSHLPERPLTRERPEQKVK